MIHMTPKSAIGTPLSAFKLITTRFRPIKEVIVTFCLVLPNLRGNEVTVTLISHIKGYSSDPLPLVQHHTRGKSISETLAEIFEIGVTYLGTLCECASRVTRKVGGGVRAAV